MSLNKPIPIVMLPTGYPAEDAVPADLHGQRFSLDKILLK